MKKILILLLFLCSVFVSAAPVNRQTLNRMLGFPLFAPQKTWSKNALQSRMKIRFSGNATRYSSRYTRKVAGADPVEIEVHTRQDGDTIKLITLTFANQGDSGKRYKSMIRNAGRAISGNISKVCGKKRAGKFSDGMFKISGDMWRTRYATFIMEMDKGDFLMLHILPVSGMREAEDPGDRDFSKNVKRNKFGDVFIHNVPMVDQGQKGYCVPATVTRILLYYGVHADMHRIAKLADTDRDDGTNTEKMLEDIKKIRRKAGLKMKNFSDVSVKSVENYIDNGIPVMWCMYSTGDLKKVYTFSRANRSKASTPKQWKRALKKVSVNNSTDGSHILLIIGYNQETDEIAVSNSWGNAHIAPLWIPVKVAKKVSQKYLIVFEP